MFLFHLKSLKTVSIENLPKCTSFDCWHAFISSRIENYEEVFWERCVFALKRLGTWDDVEAWECPCPTKSSYRNTGAARTTSKIHPRILWPWFQLILGRRGALPLSKSQNKMQRVGRSSIYNKIILSTNTNCNSTSKSGGSRFVGLLLSVKVLALVDDKTGVQNLFNKAVYFNCFPFH